MPHAIPENPRSLYLLPIGGTLAAPLAGLLLEKGYAVTGSDLELYGPMKELIRELGIRTKRGWDPANVDPAEVDLILIGNAVPRGNPEVVSVLDRDLPYCSMPEALGALVLAGRRSVVVAGTHGKTTTTSMTAWLLTQAGLDPGFLVGGTPKNFGRAFRLGSGAPFVIEGDEYNTAFFDRGAKFLHYAPTVAVITHLEFDHGDIYADLAAIEAQFEKLVALVPAAADGGALVVCADAPHARALARRCRPDAITYGLDDGSPAAELPDVRARILEEGASATRIALHAEGADRGEMWLGTTGRHNVRNALAAVAAARRFGASWEKLAEGLASFQGVRRRLDERGTHRGVTVVDDFAHHPTAVGETLLAARTRYPGRSIHVLFEPRSLTAGRNDFRGAYLDAFVGAARISFAPTFHTGRLTEDQRLDFPALAAELSSRGIPARSFGTHDELLGAAVAGAAPGDVLLFMSSGSFAGVVDRAIAALASS